MLVLSRRIGESIIIGKNIEVCVVSHKGGTIQLGVAAPEHIRVRRAEIEPLEPTNAEDDTDLE